MQPILSVCIIMKNEEKVIGRCLESISGIADEIIIVDTGSKDQSKEIALQFTDKVFDFQWVNDFSKARNFAASKARGEWILAIDADEYVDRDSFEKFKNDLLSKPPVFNIIGVQIVSFIGQNGQNTSLNHHERLYKNDGSIAYRRSIHEVLEHNDPDKAKHGIIDFQLYHSGYLTSTVQEKEKSNRNLELLLDNEHKEAIDYFFIGNEYKNIDDNNRAIQYYQKAYSFKPDLNLEWVQKLLLYLSDALHRSNRNEESLDIIETCIEAFPNVVDFKYYKGIISFNKKQYKQAKKIFEEIISKKEILRSDSSDDFLEFLPLKHLGEIYEIENDLHKSVKSYSRALSINDSDDKVWVKLISILAKHSSLEELSIFLNNNMVNKKTMTPLRVVKILLSVPNLNVQKLSRSLLDNPDLTSNENEALFIKNLQLDGFESEISESLKKKSDQEVISLLATGIFSLVDYILLTVRLESEEFIDFLYNIKYDQPLVNLYNMIFKKKNKKLTAIEESFFEAIYKQTEVLESTEVLTILKGKRAFLSKKLKNKLKLIG
ncbi:glycosyltransferase [Sporosarcina thermotolerans]|uniref:Glycosyltransferase n=1 Tax=Sporosarcina thermotolerans TaxID=633404 RepID=A0AAW9A9S7_9BACL|nr:glycosyltransferase [Sporosarcina thermotolerans]MDW0116944.1 glycosyltransferase [Sporosarcina thermotolerans]